MPTPIRPKKANGNQVNTWWIRKKVPLKLRNVVGRSEVWRSLKTTDLRTANQRIGQVSASIEAEWAGLVAQADNSKKPKAAMLESPPLSFRARLALQRVVHETARDAYIDEPQGFALMRMTAALPDPEESDGAAALDETISDFLEREGANPSPAEIEGFRPLYLKAWLDAVSDVRRAANKDYSEHPELAKLPQRIPMALDFIKWFESYCENGGLKKGVNGPTAKRWRPKIEAFCKFVGHRDLTRMTTDDCYNWADHLKEMKFSIRSIKGVWIASIRSVAAYAVERRKLKVNPFSGVRIRGNDKPREDNRLGFSDEQALKILTHTLDTPSHLTSPEMRAARRWVPWICAYSGARVNEITSLLPTDVRKDPETDIWCIYLRREVTKANYKRIIPIHSHLREQKFLEYVDARRRLGLPLFYDPARVKREESASPIWHKVAERIGKWVRESVRVTGVKPNHGWRHRFRAVARHVEMHPEIVGFILGHGGTDDDEEIQKVAMQYGDPWVKTLSKNIEKYSRYEIAALNEVPAPHKRVRRKRAEIAIADAAKAARKAARATRAPDLGGRFRESRKRS